MNRIVAYSRDNRPHIFRQFIDETKPYSIDLSKLEAELSDTVSSVTWSVTGGSATIANEALSSSIASADITTNKTGRQLIKAVCEGSTITHTVYISIKVNDPKGTTRGY